jgi:hypothetical protein
MSKSYSRNPTAMEKLKKLEVVVRYSPAKWRNGRSRDDKPRFSVAVLVLKRRVIRSLWMEWTFKMAMARMYYLIIPI